MSEMSAETLKRLGRVLAAELEDVTRAPLPDPMREQLRRLDERTAKEPKP